MITEKKATAERLYYVLGALFIAALVTCNLIANKFISIDLGFKVFTISAGVLPYPFTFLITDILSELYGQKRTTQVVLSGLIASIFVLFVLWLGAQFPAIATSPISDETYNNVFQNAWRVIAASMFAYLAAQLIDVRLFHFWKKSQEVSCFGCVIIFPPSRANWSILLWSFLYCSLAHCPSVQCQITSGTDGSLKPLQQHLIRY